MKLFGKTTVILLFALVLSFYTTGCAGCGNDNRQNVDDMVESAPAGTDEGIIEDENALNGNTNDTATDDALIDNNGGNASANNIQDNVDGVVEDNGHTVDENGNIVDDAGNIVSEAGDAVGDAINNVGNAAEDVVDGVGNGVRDLTR